MVCAKTIQAARDPKDCASRLRKSAACVLALAHTADSSEEETSRDRDGNDESTESSSGIVARQMSFDDPVYVAEVDKAPVVMDQVKNSTRQLIVILIIRLAGVLSFPRSPFLIFPQQVLSSIEESAKALTLRARCAKC